MGERLLFLERQVHLLLRYLLKKVDILRHSSKRFVIDVFILIDGEFVFVLVEQLVHVHLIWTLFLFVNPQFGHPFCLSAYLDSRTALVLARQDDPL